MIITDTHFLRYVKFTRNNRLPVETGSRNRTQLEQKQCTLQTKSPSVLAINDIKDFSFF